MSKQFYAYVHCRQDGTPFYVGKGTGRRANEFKTRSDWHKRVVNKIGGKEHVLVGVMECSSEKIAFELERGLIKCLRQLGVPLCNVTDGGEGASGIIVTQETKAKLRAIAVAQFNDPLFRQKHKDSFSRPVTLEKMSSAAIKRMADVGVRGRMQASVKKLYEDPAFLERHIAVRQTPEMRERISTKLLGHVVSAETREKMSKAKLGRLCSDETKKKMSESRKGHPTSDETKAKIGAAARARHLAKQQALLVTLQ